MSTDDALTALRTLDRDALIDTVVGEYAATRADLRDLGITDHRSRQVDHTLRSLAAHEIVEIPLVADSDPLVALVPTNALARQFFALWAYLRAESLRQQVRLAAAYIGGSDDGVIKRLYPVTYRARIGSASALHRRHQPIAQQVVATPNASLWPDGTAYFELGQPVPLGLPLGFASNPTGGAAALPGVRHHRLSQLQHLAAAGGVLKGASPA